ncbi:MAG: hypothetical protein DYH17_13265 [Xanthomonadales bacterium PRO6]|nr:hypothetical protein [Xanthomonadales bacterium PRO6]
MQSDLAHARLLRGRFQFLPQLRDEVVLAHAQCQAPASEPAQIEQITDQAQQPSRAGARTAECIRQIT